MKIAKKDLIMYGVIGLVLLILFQTCDVTVTKYSLVGSYVYNQSSESYDSLFVLENGRYRQRLYDKNRKLIFENEDKWEISGNLGVSFDNILLNEDNPIYPERIYGNNDLMHWTFQREKYFGKIKLCVNYDLEYYYDKVD
jgi:hypothetical protein